MFVVFIYRNTKSKKKNYKYNNIYQIKNYFVIFSFFKKRIRSYWLNKIFMTTASTQVIFLHIVYFTHWIVILKLLADFDLLHKVKFFFNSLLLSRLSSGHLKSATMSLNLYLTRFSTSSVHTSAVLVSLLIASNH